MLSYLTFVRQNPRFLAYGLALTWFSTVGQTYYVSLFSGDIRAEFGLSHGGFGAVYSAATLASALCLVWLGRQIDRLDLRLYSALICAGLTAACFAMAVVPASIIALGFAIFVLRLSGQGLMTHTAYTSMTRYFDANRGKAASIATLGHSLGEGTFLPLGPVLIAAIGWRESWLVAGVGLAVILIPSILWLLKGHRERHARFLERRMAASGDGELAERIWSRRDVLRDLRFYLLLPNGLATSFIMTGLLFHQVHLVESKGWSMAWFASGYIGFSLATVAGSLLFGPLIDRFSATRMLPIYQVPLAAGLLMLAFSNNPYVALLFLITCGFTSGARMAVTGAIWAEIYGVAHLGAIKALWTALMVFASAASPVLLGWLIDAGETMEAISLACFVYVIAASLLVMTPTVQTGAPALSH